MNLSIYDEKIIEKIVAEQDLTFEERIHTLMKLLYLFKSRCDAFMKDVGNEEVLANPKLKLRQSVENRLLNDKSAIEKATA